MSRCNEAMPSPINVGTTVLMNLSIASSSGKGTSAHHPDVLASFLGTIPCLGGSWSYSFLDSSSSLSRSLVPAATGNGRTRGTMGCISRVMLCPCRLATV